MLPASAPASKVRATIWRVELPRRTSRAGWSQSADGGGGAGVSGAGVDGGDSGLRLVGRRLGRLLTAAVGEATCDGDESVAGDETERGERGPVAPEARAATRRRLAMADSSYAETAALRKRFRKMCANGVESGTRLGDAGQRLVRGLAALLFQAAEGAALVGMRVAHEAVDLAAFVPFRQVLCYRKTFRITNSIQWQYL